MKRGLEGRLTALIVCHAITSAITVVFPAPVASFKAMRFSPASGPGVALAFALTRYVRYC